ncbi:MAG: amidase [Rhodospirillaceae bacterium]|nr:amidase [Rhodospirillaceae bacterium]MBT5515318.1 amidase [Rhodospirillaceae bacterium]MBT6085444.1 amidase [Rhodospirillaceae bacterium]MBT7250037.1 amidase [Rhodospirillaceae bacterium]MBT7509752.1 amidase [Rhodospirillaceae bacterium]
MTEPCDLSALEARNLIGRGDLSSVELLESCITRIETVNPTTNAIVSTDFERARVEATAAEAAVRNGDDLRPLHGLPVGIKDLNATAGLRTTYGSLLHADNVPEKDEALVARLRDAGAIIVAKTNTPEFGSGSNTTNKVFGPTRNPYDLSRTSGGSSGGSAAALATGMLPLAHGSDTFGSLRNPATWCGVVGFRPTPGLVARENRALNYTHFSVQGPMARNVRDAALMMTGLAGNDPRDAMAGPCDPASFAALDKLDLSGLRVAWSADFNGEAPLDEGIRDSFQASINSLSGLFGTFAHQAPPVPGVRDVLWTLRCLYYLANHTDRVRDHADVVSPNIVANVEAGLGMSLADAAAAEKSWSALYAGFQEFFADIDLMIVPGNAVSAFRLEDGIPKTVGGKPMENYVDASLVRSIVTLMGHPVIAVPCGLDHLGLPSGVQLVGKRGADHQLLSMALAFETAVARMPALTFPKPNLETLTP